MKKKKLILWILTIILTIIISVSTSYAATILLASNEVRYVNNHTEITSDEVQGAIDELATFANQYSSLNSKVGDTESIINNIGGYVNSTVVASTVASGTSSKTQVSTMSLTKGNWILFADVQFASNTSGYRLIDISKDGCSSDLGWISYSIQPASPSGQTILNVTIIQNPSSTTTYSLCAQQNSGSSLSVTPRMMAIKIK